MYQTILFYFATLHGVRGLKAVCWQQSSSGEHPSTFDPTRYLFGPTPCTHTGRCLVYFYGSAEYSWVPPGAVQPQWPCVMSTETPHTHPSAHSTDSQCGDQTFAELDRDVGHHKINAAAQPQDCEGDVGTIAGQEAKRGVCEVHGLEAGVGSSDGESRAAGEKSKHASRLDAMAAWGKKHSK